LTRIDFYVLPEAPPSGGDGVMTTCRLCEKAYGGGQRVYVFAPDPEKAAAVDAALWSFRQGSFIPHERLGAAALEEPLPAVLIGSEEPPQQHSGVLINLGEEVPPFFSRFERLLEIVDGDAERRARSRVRYKFYRDRGYELSMHNL
jgi:DNA polymerase-3 subunit chi